MSEFTEGLRKLADFLDARPEISPTGREILVTDCIITLDEWYRYLDLIGPDAEIEFDNDYVRARVRFAPLVSFYVFAPIERIADRTVVGETTTTIPVYEHVLKARPVEVA